MLIKTSSSSQASSGITPQAVYRRRRQFLQAGAAFLGGSLLSPAAQALSMDLSDLPDSHHNSDEKLTSYESVTTYNNFYELGSGKSDPHKNKEYLKTEPWTVEITGACHKPGRYSVEEFIRPHQLEDRIYRLRCVEAWSMVIPWVGFSAAQLLSKAQPMAKARYVAFTSVYDPDNLPGQRRRTLDWPYREGLRLDEAMHPLTIFAVGVYGEVLPPQNGAPVRVVVPWKYGFKSIKSIVKIDFVEKQPPTAWGRADAREYGFYSNVNPEVDHPRWSQKRERRIGEFFKRDTLMFNGYGEEVASLYEGMDLRKYF